jgi:hypothetical protein
MNVHTVNHLLGSSFSHKAAKEAAANVLAFLVVLVLEDTVP